MKRSLVFLLLVAFCLSNFLIVNANSTVLNLDVVIDNVLKRVDISGNINSAQGTNVTILVIDPDGAVNYIDQVLTDEDGKYETAYVLANPKEGVYVVKASSEGILTPVTKNFEYNQVTDPDPDPDPDPKTDPDPQTQIPSDGGGSSTTTPSEEVKDDNEEQLDLEEGASIIILGNTLIIDYGKLISVDDNSFESGVSFSLDLINWDELDVGVEKLTIKTSFAEIEIPIAELQRLRALNGNKGISIVLKEIEHNSLPDDIKEKAGDNPIYEFTIYINDNAITEFSEGLLIKVTIINPLDNIENPDSVIAYYINNNGKFIVVKNSRYLEDDKNMVFTTNHLSYYAVMESKATFLDLAGVEWARKSIEALAAREIVNGVGNGIYQPNRNLTREEFVKMLVVTFDLFDWDAETKFSDVDQNSWYYRYVASAQKVGITNGYTDGTFGVGKEITRQEMVVMADRALTLSVEGNILKDFIKAEGSHKFADNEFIASYAKEAIQRMYSLEIITGALGNKMNPNNNSTRAEAAKVAYNLFKLLVN